MGKINVNGKAERYYDPDLMIMMIEVCAREKTSARASEKMKADIEKLLEDLEKIGIKAENISLDEDSVEEQRDYSSQNRQEYFYVSKRTLIINLKPGVETVNAIRNILTEERIDVSMDLDYKLTNENDIRKQLLREAFRDAKEKAELIADAMDKKLVNFEKADVEHTYYEDEEVEFNRPRAEIMMDTGSIKERSSDLKTKQIRVNTSINIVWIME